MKLLKEISVISYLPGAIVTSDERKANTDLTENALGLKC